MPKVIGRQSEIYLLEKYYASSRPEFIAVYGRRRVGKTYLINNVMASRMSFAMTGVLEAPFHTQIDAFIDAFDLWGYGAITKRPENWMQAFSLLRKALTPKVNAGETVVIFLDEIPSLATRGSDFVAALGYFWNSWASNLPNIKLIVCGSATTWMLENLIDSHGGLHNRITHEMKLAPFTLAETRDYLAHEGFVWDTITILQCYMATGGVAYYLTLLDPAESLAQNIDRLYFAENGELRREYKRLFGTLFRKPEPYLKIVDLLAVHRQGLTRSEIASKLGKTTGGSLTTWLSNLEECGFIRNYMVNDGGVIKKRGSIYQLTDMFTIFHLSFVKKSKGDAHYWTHHINTPEINTWLGLAFERVCISHIEQIKTALGINMIATQCYAWRSRNSNFGAQIDMVIQRADRAINICEIKYSQHHYALSSNELEKMQQRMEAFRSETHSRASILLTLISASPITGTAAASAVPVKLSAEALFAF